MRRLSEVVLGTLQSEVPRRSGLPGAAASPGRSVTPASDSA